MQIPENTPLQQQVVPAINNENSLAICQNDMMQEVFSSMDLKPEETGLITSALKYLDLSQDGGWLEERGGQLRDMAHIFEMRNQADSQITTTQREQETQRALLGSLAENHNAADSELEAAHSEHEQTRNEITSQRDDTRKEQISKEKTRGSVRAKLAEKRNFAVSLVDISMDSDTVRTVSSCARYSLATTIGMMSYAYSQYFADNCTNEDASMGSCAASFTARSVYLPIALAAGTSAVATKVFDQAEEYKSLRSEEKALREESRVFENQCDALGEQIKEEDARHETAKETIETKRDGIVQQESDTRGLIEDGEKQLVQFRAARESCDNQVREIATSIAQDSIKQQLEILKVAEQTPSVAQAIGKPAIKTILNQVLITVANSTSSSNLITSSQNRSIE